MFVFLILLGERGCPGFSFALSIRIGLKYLVNHYKGMLYMVLVFSQSESLSTIVIIYTIYIHCIYIIAIIRERKIRLRVEKGKQMAVENDIFAKFGGVKDKVTFSCRSGMRNGRHTYICWQDIVIVVRLENPR